TRTTTIEYGKTRRHRRGCGTKIESTRQKERTSMKTKCTSRLRFFNSRDLIGFALYAAGLVLAFAPMGSAVAGDNVAAELSAWVPAQATGGTWTATGVLGTPRDEHTATLLPNDQVLVTGGTRFELRRTLGSAELY